MKRGDKKRRWWEMEEPHPTEPLTPEEEQFVVNVALGCFMPMAIILILFLLLIICVNA